MATRRRYTPEFKAEVVLTALRADRTNRQVASEYGIHPNLVSRWKCQLCDSLPDIFERGTPADRAEAEVRALQAEMKQVTLERDFLNAALDSEEGRRARDQLDPERKRRS